MKKIALSMCVAMAVVALAGCGKKDGAEDGGEGPTEAPADAPAAAPAATGVSTGLKPGAWQMTTSMAGMAKGMTSTFCLDEALSAKFTDLGSSNRGNVDCTNKSVNRSGNTIDVVSVCRQDGHTVNTKVHVELQGENAYHQTAELTFDPPVAGKETMTSTVDGKWLGTCDSQGLKAGDMVMPGGMKMNMADMKKRG